MTDPKDPKKKKKKDNNNPYSLKNIQKSYPNAIAVYPRENSLGSTVMFKGGGSVSLNRGRYTQKQESLASAIDKVINKK